MFTRKSDLEKMLKAEREYYCSQFGQPKKREENTAVKRMALKTVKNEMKAHKIKQSEAAEHIGVMQNTVSRWLSGKKPITYENLCKLCEYVEERCNDEIHD